MRDLIYKAGALLFLAAFISYEANAACATQISRTNFSANSVLTSTELNSQFNTAYNRVNDLPGDCIQDATVNGAKLINESVELAKLSSLVQGAIGSVGDVKMFHTFNGTLSIPRGWMILNGDVVNQANYDAIHGTGAYTEDGVSASLLLSKNLPNQVGKFPKGALATTQDGTSAITSTGNTGNQITIAAHNHQWYSNNAPNAAFVYDSSGAFIQVDAAAGTDLVSATLTSGEDAYYFNRQSGTGGSVLQQVDLFTANAGSSTQNIEPAGNEFIYIIKVI